MERCVSSSSEKPGPFRLLVTMLLLLPCCTSISVLMKVILIKIYIYISVYPMFRMSLSNYKERYTFSRVYRMNLIEDEPRKLVPFGADFAACNEAALQMH